MWVNYRALILCGACLAVATTARAQVYNLKVVTDASPDYSDLPSMIHSITSRWPTAEEKCWAMFYWNHIARRQTSPMMLHGMALTDPIRQFNDYGYTMCSTIAGINCAIWDAMGLKVKYWDIANHTVAEVFYADGWHMYDNSMSALYTLCDGKTLAGVSDIGKPGGCAASGGRIEPGHIARYHCLNAMAPRSFLTGADCARSVAEEAHCFNPNALKYRSYYCEWDRGHRYILNVRPGEAYARHYKALGRERKYYVPNEGKDPDEFSEGKSRFGLRGNGVWSFKPRLTLQSLAGDTVATKNLEARPEGGITPARPGEPAEAVFKIEGANVITALAIRGQATLATGDNVCRIAVSTTNGVDWREVWRNEKTGAVPLALELIDEVNGAYEVLVRVQLAAKTAKQDARLDVLEFETTTMVNSKTQPQLLLGRNTIYAGRGEQTDSVVLWPDLRRDRWPAYLVEHQNMVAQREHPGYMGVIHAAKAKEEACVVFRIDAPGDISRLTYGGRLYNRAPKAHIDFLHSFDNGKTWTKSYSLTDTKMPWDVLHTETIEQIPAKTRSILVKYLLDASEAGTSACSIYAVRMEANYRPATAVATPVEVTYHWSEIQADRSKVARSHTQVVREFPSRYTIDVAGADHPVVESLVIRGLAAGEQAKETPRPADAKPAAKFVPRWMTYGKNLAEGKPYTVSIPSATSWDAGDPKGDKLTNGIIGPPYAGGPAASFGLCWTDGQKPDLTVDLGKIEKCGAFRIHVTGYPFWDAMKGEVADGVEVLVSQDGREFRSLGPIEMNLRRKDLPANFMAPDEETATGPIFALIPPSPVEARYVRFKLTAKRFMMVSEVQVLDRIEYEPFDLRLALPDDSGKR